MKEYFQYVSRNKLKYGAFTGLWIDPKVHSNMLPVNKLPFLSVNKIFTISTQTEAVILHYSGI